MSATVTSLFVSACVFAGGMAGLFGYPRLPTHHRTKETLDVIRLGIGMLSVLSSLVLGLLIATAKGGWDATDHAVRGYAADLILLDETLRDYGDTAAAPRATLRAYTERMLRDVWSPGGGQALGSDRAGEMLEHVREQIRALAPTDPPAKWLQDQALDTHISLLRQRWHLIELQGPSVQPAVLVILVLWIIIIFASFGLNAPRNATVVGAFLLCSLAIGGSIFLILEMDSPFNGVLTISSEPLRIAVAHMTPPGR